MTIHAIDRRTINTAEIAEELCTLRDLIRWGVSAFNEADLSFVQGMPNALDEAVYLCLAALHLPPDFSESFFDCVLTFEEKVAVLEDYKLRIQENKPAAYITHESWFAGLDFYVDERVLIPRSPIAELVRQQFAPWIDVDDVHHVLDMCTGSGCIAIACANVFDQAQVAASDISGDALAVAEINRERHGLDQRLQLVQSNLYTDIPQKQYDIIVSNPPYVSDGEMRVLSEELKSEPALGLAAGEAGLDIVIPILQGAREFMSDHGILVVEVGYSQSALEQCLPNVPFFWLDFEHGGDGVFLLTAEQLEIFQNDLDAV
jgi:ribosomal protein L3 glutamine methyltransferase